MSRSDCANFLFSAKTGGIDEGCVKSLVSSLLGFVIPLGALGLKLPQVRCARDARFMNIIHSPQIFAILSSGNVEGLSALAMYNEVPLVLTSVAYNVLRGNPFSTYGENVFILIQNVMLVLLLWKYTAVSIFSCAARLPCKRVRSLSPQDRSCSWSPLSELFAPLVFLSLLTFR